MIQIMLWDLQADGNSKYLILGLYCRRYWLILSTGIITSCSSRRNDEWYCEKNAIIPYMVVYL
jgi:hypothetical protein